MNSISTNSLLLDKIEMGGTLRLLGKHCQYNHAKKH
jgi:hypothetical protein